MNSYFFQMNYYWKVAVYKWAYFLNYLDGNYYYNYLANEFLCVEFEVDVVVPADVYWQGDFVDAQKVLFVV